MRYIEPPEGLPWALLGICCGSVALNLILGGMLMSRPGAPDEHAVAEATVDSEQLAELAEAAAVPEQAADIAPDDQVKVPEGITVAGADVAHSLARTFQTIDPERADVLSAIYARLFVWDLDLRRDIQAGDRVRLAYEWENELAVIQVATYTSGKLGETLHAYRLQAQGDEFASWWDETGTEVPRRLKATPLAQYEQVTSLLKDRPNHKGMDFKVPVGTDVLSPKQGTVVRTNWNVKYNGNCVEVRYDDGSLARFLHLSNTIAKAGQRMSAGGVVGLSGNTGRSTAPHLHYEIEKAGRVVDPVNYHGTYRRSLGAADMAKLQSMIPRLDALLDTDS